MEIVCREASNLFVSKCYDNVNIVQPFVCILIILLNEKILTLTPIYCIYRSVMILK